MSENTSVNSPTSPSEPPPPNNAPVTPSPVPQPTRGIVKQSPFKFIAPVVVILIVLGIIFFGITKILQPKLPKTNNQSQGNTSIESTEIEYWGLWEPSIMLDEIFAEFESTNPGTKIKYIQQSPQDYRKRLSNALASDKGPDVFRFHVTWGVMLDQYLSTLPESIMSKSEFDQTFYPVAQEWLQSPGGYIGVPLMHDGLGLFYNRTIFDSAGITPPSTWEELRDLANKLTIKNEQGQIQQAGIALGGTKNVDHWSDILGLMMLQNAADPTKPNNNLGQTAVDYYLLFRKDGVWDDSMAPSTFAFASEKTAMIIAPTWRAHEILAINPNIKFSIAKTPTLPGIDISWATFWAEGVSRKSSNSKQQASWQLLSYLSSKDVMRKLYTAAAQQERLFGAPFSRVDLADQLVGDPFVGSVIDQASVSKTWYMNSRTFDDGINDKIIKYYEDALNLILYDAQPTDKALETAESGIQQILNPQPVPQTK